MWGLTLNEIFEVDFSMDILRGNHNRPLFTSSWITAVPWLLYYCRGTNEATHHRAIDCAAQTSASNGYQIKREKHCAFWVRLHCTSVYIARKAYLHENSLKLYDSINSNLFACRTCWKYHLNSKCRKLWTARHLHNNPYVRHQMPANVPSEYLIRGSVQSQTSQLCKYPITYGNMEMRMQLT